VPRRSFLHNFIRNRQIRYATAIYEGVQLLASKKGEKYKCDECGLVVVVEDPCGCESVELICCETPMKPVKAAKTKPKAKPKPKVKPAKKAKAKATKK
jgi:hypothetical protein